MKYLTIVAALLAAGCTTPYVTDSGAIGARFTCALSQDPALNAIVDAKVAALIAEGKDAEAAALAAAVAAARAERDAICAGLDTPVSGIM